MLGMVIYHNITYSIPVGVLFSHPDDKSIYSVVKDSFPEVESELFLTDINSRERNFRFAFGRMTSEK